MRGKSAIQVLVVGLLVTAGCGHQVSVPSSSTPPRDSPDLPFAQSTQLGGISPSSAVIPPGARVPAGTPVTVHLNSAISSATTHAGETFDAVLDEPIIVNGQVVAERGATVTGRVMEAKAARLAKAPGYLRLTLDTISVNGQALRAVTSSTFAKGVSVRKRGVALAGNESGRSVLLGTAVPASGLSPMGNTAAVGGKGRGAALPAKEVTMGPERRLTFRLTEPIPLHE